jgi:3-methyl-2-oxobutanoate hydroxymethyltransferase
MKTTLAEFIAKKKTKTPITVLTAYDFPMARIEDEAGVDVVLIGDSVGTNVLGYASEQEVTMADMEHHTAAVARGVTRAHVMADLPYHSAEDPLTAEKNSLRLLEKGAGSVKLEGWGEKQTIIKHLSKKGIPVCAHIGYNPQTHGMKAKMFGATAAEAHQLIEAALNLEAAGAGMIILEKIPEEVAHIITEKLAIPTIGIGSGRFCDGQVLVLHDILGFTPKAFKHARRFADLRTATLEGVTAYAKAVTNGSFPAEENLRHMEEGERGRLEEMMRGRGI